MKYSTKILIGGLAVFLFLSCFVHAQTPLLMPIPEQQFFTPTGTVCSGCFLYTYVSGSFTPLGTNTDATAGALNTNPIVLNAAGYPQNSIGTLTGIWLFPTSVYRIVLQNAAHVNIWQVDGITGQIPASLNGPLNILQIACNQITIGTTPNLTGLCFPAPSGAITLTFPATTDTIVGRATTDTLNNKTLNNPLFNGTGCGITNGPGTYVCIPNANPTGTTTATVTILINTTSQASIATNTTTTGAIGICVASCSNAGTATIQQSGTVPCAFDGATVAGHYVSISSTLGGDCHDAGASPANGVQVIGQVLSTNGGAGTYQIDLYPPGLITPINNPLVLLNDTTTGTLLNGLVKQAASLTFTTTAIRTATSDTADVIGIANSGAGTTGSATIQQIGFAQCVFDGPTTVNDFIVVSVTVAGNCHDSGVAYPALPPTTQQVIGQVLSTNAAGGTYGINLYGPSVLRPASFNAPQRATAIINQPLVANTQTIVLTETVTFPSTPGTYRALVSYGFYTNPGAACSGEVIDTTNSKAYALSFQDSNGGSGTGGSMGSELSNFTYAAAATPTFTLQVQCNFAVSVVANSALFTFVPAEPTHLSVTPVLSNN